MSLEDFHLINNAPSYNSITKKHFSKVYHQHGLNLNNPDQYVEFIFGGNNNYH